MDISTSSPFPRPPLSSASGERLAVTGVRETNDDHLQASKLGEWIIVVVIICVFALVVAPIGAVAGALIGLATETGLLRGAGIGVISGALFSAEALESSLALWYSHVSRFNRMLYLVYIICSLLSGILVRAKVGYAVQRAMQSQLSALEMPYADPLDIFETGEAHGMSKESFGLLPELMLTMEAGFDCYGERISCSVCLQEIQIGETVRRLPCCQHMFHMRCIDTWLIRNASCPLCRRDV